jgi:hypothetical protein
MNRTIALATLLLVIFGCQTSDGLVVVSDDGMALHQSNFGIINGVPPNAAHHGATVSLHQLVQGGTAVQVGPFCSGTLVATDVVLTAAHCLDTARGGPNFKTMAPSLLAVYVGDEPAVDILQHLYLVAVTQIHPSYNRNALRNDLALLELTTDVTEAAPVPHLPASLGLTTADLGMTVNYAGFGQTQSGSSGLKLQVDGTLDAFGCDVGAWGCYGDAGDPATQFSSAQAGGGTCFGDSGGSGFVNRNGTWYVVGATSWGDNNCTVYGVNTRADAFDAYIDAFIGVPPQLQPPIADAGGPYAGFEGDAVAFDGSNSNDPDGGTLTYDWDFGDGNFGTGATPTHTYAGTGSWTVDLTVTDDEGDTDGDSTSVTVTTAPACTFTGTLSSSNRNDAHPIGVFNAGEVISGSLSWDSASANLNLYLQYQNNRGQWKNQASSTNSTPGAAEFVSYTVSSSRSGRNFRWLVKRKSGTATYCLAG